jgi:N-acetylmuramoyl-L-alanine amidase
MKRIAALAITASLLLAQTERAALQSVTAIRHWEVGDVTRIAIEVSGDCEFRTDRLHNPERVYYDLVNTRPHIEGVDHRKVYNIEVGGKLVERVRVALTAPGVTRIVLDLNGAVETTPSMLSNPSRLMIELRSGKTVIPTRTLPAPAEPSIPIADRSIKPAPTVCTGCAAGKTPASVPEPAVRPTPAAEAKPYEKPVAKAPEAHTPSTARPEPLKPEPPKDTVATTKETPALPVAPAVVRSTDKAADLPKPEALKPEPVKAPAAKADAPKSEPPNPETPKPEAIKTDAPARPAPGPAMAELSKAAKHTSTGGSSLTRALGLKIGRIVIDPGHGGHDQGTQGAKGLLEKELVLDVALRVGKMIEDRMNAEVIYTRSDDTFIPLEGRTAIANEKKADLFLSIHANSSPYPRIAGVETFYLNFTDSKDALDVASRENATSQKSIFELQDIIHQITLHEKLDESREFASRVQNAMFAFTSHNVPGEKNRGIKKAPFVVLIGASMPSILAEIGFLTNAREEQLLKKPDYRQKLADALYRGVARYAEGLSHFQLAQNTQSSQ